jgi:hypothetical protein
MYTHAHKYNLERLANILAGKQESRKRVGLQVLKAAAHSQNSSPLSVILKHLLTEMVRGDFGGPLLAIALHEPWKFC